MRDQIFWQTFTITVLQFDLEWSKFAPGTQVRRSIFPGGQPRPYSKGRGHLCSPDFVGTPYRCLNRLTYCDEIWCGYTWGAACFYGSATPRPKGRVPATQILLWSFYVRWIRATKFGTGARGHGHVLWSATSPFQGGWASAFANFGTDVRPHSKMRNNNRIMHGDQTWCEANFTRSITNAGVQSVCVRPTSSLMPPPRWAGA